MKRQIMWMLFVTCLVAATICFFYVTPGVWRYSYESYGPVRGRYILRTDKLTTQVFRYDASKAKWIVYKEGYDPAAFEAALKKAASGGQ